MAHACIGMPLTPSSSLTAKKTIFTFVLELLNDGASRVESYFNTNDSRATGKKWARKHAKLAKREEPKGRKPILGTLADETDTMPATTLPDTTSATTPMPICKPAPPDHPVPVKPHAKTPEPNPQPNPPPATKTDLQVPSPLSESAVEPHPLPPTPTGTHSQPLLTGLELERQCHTLVLEEEDGIQRWLIHDGKVDLRLLRVRCEDCPSRAVAVKLCPGPRNHTFFYQKCYHHASWQCSMFSPSFEEWVDLHIPMDPTP